MEYILKKHFSNFMATDQSPNRPIEKIACRIKTKNSMLEKLAGRKITEKQHISPGLGDIIGARIVLNDAKNCDEILEKFRDMAQRGYLKITEIENYAQKPDYAYASQKSLKELASTCKKHIKGFIDKPFNKTRDSGYTAIHLGVQLPDNIVGEIQIMGKHVEKFKDIDDIIYKIECNKQIKPEYKTIVDTLTQPGKNIRTDSAVRDAMKTHRQEQFAFARDKEISGKIPKKDFLPIPKDLPEEFDFNNLSNLQTSLDNLAKVMSPEEIERLL
jgi:ppGpp synthetase/RelA/SpoT-type nucleotidyltranferase